MLSGVVTYYIIVTIGITLGYHRYFSHSKFKASKLAEVIMLLCGVLCGGRSALSWSAVHRMHHAHADTEKDPHGTGWTSFLSLWKVKHIPRSYVKDLIKNPRVMWFHRYGKYVVVPFFVIFPIQMLVIFFLSYLGFGVLNRFGHRNGQPVNRWWINLIAPWEGNHECHHKRSKNR